MSKKRGSVFSVREIELLTSLVAQRRDIVLNKKSDVATWRKKEEAWKEIAGSFGYLTGTSRDPKQLKNKWDLLKSKIKRKIVKCKEETMESGKDPLEEAELTSQEKAIQHVLAGDLTEVGITFESSTPDGEDSDTHITYVSNNVVDYPTITISEMSKNEDSGHEVLFEAHLSLPKMAKETRRFFLYSAKARSVARLRGHLESIFCGLQKIRNYIICYKTETGMIPVSTDSELSVFLKDTKETKTLFISEGAKTRIFEVSIKLSKPELRVLYIDEETAQSFSSLKTKFASLIPSLEQVLDFDIQWTDDAGRDILMGSDDELSYFLDTCSETFKVAIVPRGSFINTTPAEKVDETLKKLTCLGFHNERDWLRSLLVAEKGDVLRVLQTISNISCASLVSTDKDS